MRPGTPCKTYLNVTFVLFLIFFTPPIPAVAKVIRNAVENDIGPCPGDGVYCLYNYWYWLNYSSSTDYNHPSIKKIFNKNYILDRDDFKCNHDVTHRVCAKLVDNKDGMCKRLKWGSKNFWQLTNQIQYDWSQLICSDRTRDGNTKLPGEHWCICMWATEELINEALI